MSSGNKTTKPYSPYSIPYSPNIAGIDEAGRGALAGPVVAGACIIPCELFRRRKPFVCWSPHRKPLVNDRLIADSKALTPEERERTYEWIVAHCPYGVGVGEVEVIERHGILAATELAMLRALEDLRSKAEPDFLLIDGKDSFRFPIPHRSIVRGDATEACIAAGSIVAKVSRDRLMAAYRTTHERYGFERHKGYGTVEHIAAIRLHGPCELHRMSFLTRVVDDAVMAEERLPTDLMPPAVSANATIPTRSIRQEPSAA